MPAKRRTTNFTESQQSYEPTTSTQKSPDCRRQIGNHRDMPTATASPTRPT